MARRRRGSRGFAMVVLLAAMAVIGVGLAAIGPLWSEEARRAKEEDLLRIGVLYAQAIADYRANAPGSDKRFPPSLESLVEDRRFVGVRRYLRRLYPDPTSPQNPWGVIRAPDGGIMGVFSTSQDKPLRTTALTLGVVDLPSAQRYADWRFMPKVNP